MAKNARVKGSAPDPLPANLGGMVTPFKGNGRKLGYPTANFKTSTKLRDGVYFGWADLGQFKAHPAVIFIGTPTTLWDIGRRVEAFLLDIPDRDYYGLEIKLDIRAYHRGNKTFDSIEELVIAMKADEKAGKKWFGQHSFERGVPEGRSI